jgi:thaumarchaeosortase
MASLLRSFRIRTPRRLNVADLFLVLSAIPILFMLALAPETFGLSWAGFGKLGRGGLLFVLFFLAFELMDFRKNAIPSPNRTRKIAAAILVSTALLYFGGVAGISRFADSIYWIGRVLGAAGEFSNSWLMAMDYLAFAVYIVVLAIVLFGSRAFKATLTAVVFSVGMLAMYLLDAFFPYGTIGPLQFWANFIVACVAFLSRVFGLPIFGFSNHLTILGKHGTFALVVFWPSVGVHSMLIYSLVMVVLAAKLVAPWRRKALYVVVGVAGTIFLNVVRIFIITYYGYIYATSAAELDAFHNSIGEFLFPLWIIIFIVIVLDIESRISARTKRLTAENLRTPETKLGHSDPFQPGAIGSDPDRVW